MTFSIEPIGVLRCEPHAKGDLPRQSGLGFGPPGRIELDRSIPLEALDDLAEFDRIWVITWLDRAEGWKPKVLPPRGDEKRGLFATRAPHRPQPIGLSCVRLIAIEGRTLAIDDHDLLDGTPILDLKPYLPYADAFPDAAAGWAAAGWQPHAVEISPEARAALDWLAERGVALEPILHRTLALRPDPQPGHRVTVGDEGRRTWAWRTWRVDYRMDPGQKLTVERLRSGLDPDRDPPVDDPRDAAELHRKFRREFSP